MYPRDLLSTANNQVGSSTTSSSSTGLQTLLGVVVGTLAVLLILLAVLLLLLLRCGEIETPLVVISKNVCTQAAAYKKRLCSSSCSRGTRGEIRFANVCVVNVKILMTKVPWMRS